ncbi:MAG: hypothetical protein ACRC2K_04340 [Clostridium sp.]
MEVINIEENLRLTRFKGHYEFALKWYEDEEMVKFVDGKEASPYDMDKLSRMYNYLNAKGELYFIEVKDLGTGYSYTLNLE